MKRIMTDRSRSRPAAAEPEKDSPTHNTQTCLTHCRHPGSPPADRARRPTVNGSGMIGLRLFEV